MDYKHANLNKYKSEGSIAQWYIIQETMSFCESYLQEENDGEDASTSSSAPKYSISVYSDDVVVFGNLHRKWNLSRDDLAEAHWAVLLNADEIDIYRQYHLANVATDLEDHKRRFSDYLLEWVSQHLFLELINVIEN